MGKRLERFGEVGIVDETNGFGLDLAIRETLKGREFVGVHGRRTQSSGSNTPSEKTFRLVQT